MDPTFFASAADWRAWLEAHHATVTELVIGFHRKHTARGGLTYTQALDEALCFGWIDGVRRSHGPDAYTTRFTPRRRGSSWSQVNIRRVEELTALGLMHPAGQRAFEARTEAATRRYSHENDAQAFGEAGEAQFRANPAAWAFFEAQPASYRRAATWWVVSAKQAATRARRLASLIDHSERGLRIPQFLSPAKRPKRSGEAMEDAESID